MKKIYKGNLLSKSDSCIVIYDVKDHTKLFALNNSVEGKVVIDFNNIDKLNIYYYVRNIENLYIREEIPIIIV
jgi:hypothetical protein